MTDGGGGFDYVLEKVDTIGAIDGKKRRTCYRCGVINFMENMKRVGSRYYCHPKPSCWDRSYAGRGDK